MRGCNQQLNTILRQACPDAVGHNRLSDCPLSVTIYVLTHDCETYSRILTCQCSTVILHNVSVNHDMHCAYNVTVRHLRVTTVATERQHLVLSVLLSYTSPSTIYVRIQNVAQQCSYHGTTSPATVKCNQSINPLA